jgi:hypothetical protein
VRFLVKRNDDDEAVLETVMPCAAACARRLFNSASRDVSNDWRAAVDVESEDNVEVAVVAVVLDTVSVELVLVVVTGGIYPPPPPPPPTDIDPPPLFGIVIVTVAEAKVEILPAASSAHA